ncbi:hypothetical protein VTN00DRAFT_5809 [Thermoascus crustaceus]|uniref:uncharacterized protein n=1 Tax=Thermoascus crustaceus TaxID=5088 RepID=UPI0037434814
MIYRRKHAPPQGIANSRSGKGGGDDGCSLGMRERGRWKWRRLNLSRRSQGRTLEQTKRLDGRIAAGDAEDDGTAPSAANRRPEPDASLHQMGPRAGRTTNHGRRWQLARGEGTAGGAVMDRWIDRQRGRDITDTTDREPGRTSRARRSRRTFDRRVEKQTGSTSGADESCRAVNAGGGSWRDQPQQRVRT